MAKFVLGALVTNIAGSVGGTTLRRVPNGFSMYNKPKGTSTSRLLSNARLPEIGKIFQRWALLSDAERAGWNAQALLITFPDKFGNAKNLTGRQLFSKANIQLLPTGNSVNDSTSFSNEYPEFILTTYTFDVSIPAFQVTVEAPIGVGQVLISVEISNKQIYQPTFKSRKVIWVGDIESPDANIQFPLPLLAQYPYVSDGMWIAVYVQSINSFGMLSPYQYIIAEIQG